MYNSKHHGSVTCPLACLNLQLTSDMDSEEPMDLETPRPKDPSTDDTVCVDLSQQPYHSPHGQQISMAEYKKQSGSYTQQAVKDLKASPEFKMYTQRCLRL